MFPKSTPPALVLFDCDGVLVDSEPISNVIFTQELNKAGVALGLVEVQQRYTGMSMPDIKIAVADEFGIELDETWHDEYRRISNAAFADRLEAIPHVQGAVEAIRDAGLPYCVASSGPIDKMETTLGITGLLPLFDGRLFTGWDVPHGKPHPDLFLHVAKEFGALPDQCIVIEDSGPGVRAGVAAGMAVLGYTPPSNPHSLVDLGATLFDDMRQLPGLLGL